MTKKTPYVGKRKQAELERASVFDDVLRQFDHTFVDDPSDQWNEEETRLFDIASEIEI